MRISKSAAGILVSSLAAFVVAPAAAVAGEQTVNDFEAAQQAAWNAHDAAAYAAAFDQDAAIVTSPGWRWTGQADAAHNLGDGFKLVYAKAHLQVSDMQVRALTPDLALVTLRWTIDGARTVDGALQAGEQHGFQTQVLRRRGESWLILSQQDTLAGAETPVAAVAQPAAAQEKAPAPATAFPTTPPPVRRCVVARGNGECLIYGKAKPAPAN